MIFVYNYTGLIYRVIAIYVFLLDGLGSSCAFGSAPTSGVGFLGVDLTGPSQECPLQNHVRR